MRNFGDEGACGYRCCHKPDGGSGALRDITKCCFPQMHFLQSGAGQTSKGSTSQFSGEFGDKPNVGRMILFIFLHRSRP